MQTEYKCANFLSKAVKLAEL